MILLRAGRVQIEQDNFCPGLCEPGCDSAANPTCGAGDADASLRIECESTRFRGAHDAALREIRVATRRPSTQRVTIESLTRLSHLPLIHFSQGRHSPMRPDKTNLSLDLLRWRQLRSLARWGRRLPGQIRVLICQLLFTQPPIDLF